jgi:hypothetical protein
MIQIGNFGVKVIFGKIPDLPVHVPAGALGYKIKARQKDVARIFVRFKDGIEQRFLVEIDGELSPGPLCAENRRKTL